MATFAVRQPAEQPQQSQRAETAKSSQPEKEVAKSFWIKTIEDPVSSFTAALVAMTTVLAVVSVVQIRFLTRADETARIAADASRKQAATGAEQFELSRQEAAYTRRPHFRVRFARLVEVDGVALAKGRPVSVMLDVLNNGQADAVIQASHLEIFWNDKGLPTSFPYIPDMPFNHFASGGENKRHVIHAGGGTQFVKVQGYRLMDERVTDIKLGMSGWTLYLLGWIGCRRPDDKYNRFFDFALQFKPETGRFLPVENDPDYSHDPDGK